MKGWGGVVGWRRGKARMDIDKKNNIPTFCRMLECCD